MYILIIIEGLLDALYVISFVKSTVCPKFLKFFGLFLLN